MGELPVVSIDQPYASLIMAGVKRFETRPAPPNGNMRPDGVRGLPGARVNRGDRLLIASTARKPQRIAGWFRPRRLYGEWKVERDTTKRGDPFPSHETLWLPLGCILGSVTVTDAYPILSYNTKAWGEFVTDPANETATYIDNCADSLFLPPEARGLFIRWTRREGTSLVGGSTDITDQVPLGDWTPGRWAWALTDPQPLDEPIPVTGKQGVWKWEP